MFCRYNREKYRKVKICPVSGCGAKPQRKLANHIAVKHPNIKRKERLELLAAAKPAPRTKYIPQVHLQQKLNFTRQRPANTHADRTASTRSLEAGQNYKVSVEESTTDTSCNLSQLVSSSPSPLDSQPPSPLTRGTKSLELFLPSRPAMAKFKDYLMSLDGKRNKEHVSHAICRDVGKILFFCNPNVPTWDSLINRTKVMGFIELLRNRGMQADGQLTKLERLCDGLEYAEKYEFVESGPKEAFLTSIKSWKKTLRSDKTRCQVERIEEASEGQISMAEISNVVDSPHMWNQFDMIVNEASMDKPLSKYELKLATAIVAMTVMLKSYQR